jgi:hypothetical protein
MDRESTFIVRLYRQARRPLAGVVEDVRSGRRMPFADAEELWRALTSNPRLRKQRATPGKAQ